MSQTFGLIVEKSQLGRKMEIVSNNYLKKRNIQLDRVTFLLNIDVMHWTHMINVTSINNHIKPVIVNNDKIKLKL